jgi:hypothetical protein
LKDFGLWEYVKPTKTPEMQGEAFGQQGTRPDIANSGLAAAK